MAEYIEKNNIINLLEHNDKVYHYADRDKENIVHDTVQTLCRVIIEAKAADVQPVKHGKWKQDEEGYDTYIECSRCGISLNICEYEASEWREVMNFCPCCGADMRGGEENA